MLAGERIGLRLSGHRDFGRREREVITLVTSGLLNKQVGGELGISEITVKAHRGNVMRKMGASSLVAVLLRPTAATNSPKVAPALRSSS